MPAQPTPRAELRTIASRILDDTPRDFQARYRTDEEAFLEVYDLAQSLAGFVLNASPDKAGEVNIGKLTVSIVTREADATFIDEATLERMARAHDLEDAAQKGEPSPWREEGDAEEFATFKAERITAMRCAVESLFDGEGRA